MYKTATVEIEIEVEDIKEFLEYDFNDLNSYEYHDLMKIMKNLVLNYSYYGTDTNLDASDIIHFLKNNPDIAKDVKGYLNQNEVL